MKGDWRERERRTFAKNKSEFRALRQFLEQPGFTISVTALGMDHEEAHLLNGRYSTEIEKSNERIEPNGGEATSMTYTLGELLRELKGEEIAFQQNMRNVEAKDNPILRHGAEIQARITRSDWLKMIRSNPGVDQIESICNANGSELASSAVLSLRGKYCVETGQSTSDANQISVTDFVEAISGVPQMSTSDFYVPSRYRHLEESLRRFHEDDPFDKSVFVMMKFPDSSLSAEQNQFLDRMCQCVTAELDRHGLVARRADKKTYAGDRLTWNNLCVYMLGCKYGVAILEDRVLPELNPNVALEYGFMQALGRDLLLLIESSFERIRADIVGTIPKRFRVGVDLAIDETSVKDSVSAWMIDVGVPAKRAR